ncbi:hypothetical protein DERP_006786 [Dermatophagoides pteronyssinus]|uniref:Uncharacterized protein n=1 Tax=Dermatophagoides pteronyssinus TaxID=6956 RepID=A0ABQ8ISR2_DERPT|nr:hypothetical protein DERP_006786 [Dermatophagoides pteronyssinus]
MILYYCDDSIIVYDITLFVIEDNLLCMIGSIYVSDLNDDFNHPTRIKGFPWLPSTNQESMFISLIH